jgi:hypothetical protein
MKISTILNPEPRIINSPEYQEYLEFLEEEAMSKNPDDFCFMTANKSNYSEADFDVFSAMEVESYSEAAFNDEYLTGYRIIQAAI